MEAFAENSIRLSSGASPPPENRDPIIFSNDRDAEIYEEIEAPKFVDFTSLERYRPDDRYWFCFRVGCDQKHEEEMDSEEIYKRFVLRVTAARSPYMKLRKALERKTSRTPLKCPLSAPPKPSKPKSLSLTTIPMKRSEEQKKEVNPKSTPVNKCRVVAAKYLSTPRNKNCAQQASFRSVQNHKPRSVHVPESGIVAKALFPKTQKKEEEVKMSCKLKSPVPNLLETMKKMEISTKSCKDVSKDSSSRSRRLSNSKTKGKLKQEQRLAKIRKAKKDAAKLPISLVANDASSLKKKDVSRPLDQCVDQGLQEHTCEHSNVQSSAGSSELSLPQDMQRDEKNVFERENGGVEDTSEGKNSYNGDPSTATKNANDDDKENGSASELNRLEQGKNSYNDDPSTATENVNDDDKENASASELNRCAGTDLDQTKRKILGILHKSDNVQKVVEEVKLKRKNTTNPKPFRLRTDERSVLREANAEKKVNCIDTAKACAVNLSTLAVKPVMKQNEVQKELKKTEASKHPASKPTTSQGNNAMQRLDTFKKATTPPLEKGSTRIQRLVSPMKKMTSYLIPGQKLDTIHENSSKTWELRPPQKTATGFRRHDGTRESNFHHMNVPRRPLRSPNS